MAIQEVNDASFKNEVSSGIVLVDFWAPWCAPCRMVAPVLEDLQNELAGKVKVIKVNVDENPQVSSLYGITSIPTIMIFKNGEMVERQVGAGPKQHYLSLLNKHLG